MLDVVAHAKPIDSRPVRRGFDLANTTCFGRRLLTLAPNMPCLQKEFGDPARCGGSQASVP